MGNCLPFEVEVRLCRELEERVLAVDRVITLEYVLVVRIKPAPALKRVFVEQRVSLAVTIPVGVTHSPSIFNRDEVIRLLFFRREHAGRPGVADRGVHRQLQEHRGLEKLLGNLGSRLRVDRTSKDSGPCIRRRLIGKPETSRGTVPECAGIEVIGLLRAGLRPGLLVVRWQGRKRRKFWRSFCLALSVGPSLTASPHPARGPPDMPPRSALSRSAGTKIEHSYARLIHPDRSSPCSQSTGTNLGNVRRCGDPKPESFQTGVARHSFPARGGIAAYAIAIKGYAFGDRPPCAAAQGLRNRRSATSR